MTVPDAGQLDLRARSEELAAAERRLVDMERDLIEISLANENYRSQVTILNTRLDAAESELRAARQAATDPESRLVVENVVVSEGHHQEGASTRELMVEKAALQARISDQLSQIEALNGEVSQLRSEVVQLTRQMASDHDDDHSKECFGNSPPDGSTGHDGGVSRQRKRS